MTRNLFKRLCAIAFALLLLVENQAFCQTESSLQVAGLISDNMVVQRDQPLVVWGWAAAGTNVTVRMQQQQKTVTAGDDSAWKVSMDPIGLGPAFEIEVITAAESKTFSNCIAGEVWVCSGQSNMEWTVRASGNPDEEIAAADYPMIRHINIENRTSPLPNTGNFECSAWEICSPETAANFTAVGYYFARELHQELDVPIGLINTTWGGTIVEAWTSGESCMTVDAFRDRVEEIKASAGDGTSAREYQQRVEQWSRDFQAALADESDQWQGTDIDDSDWKAMDAPGNWEGQGYRQLDGVVWFRRTLRIPDALAGREAVLSLGKIDDFDKTYVNGQLVGSTNAWMEDRRYEIPADLVTAGEMTIAVRVVDTSGGGGFHGEAANYFFEIGGQDRVNLAGPWKYKLSTSTEALGTPPVNPMRGPNHPTLLYNAMVSPILNASFRGAIWYQGESNAGRAHQYRTIFPLLVTDWRDKFGRDFPFYWVQLANFRPANDQPVDSDWAELRRNLCS
ncbi:MAG: sialate O-acetylesterase [Planctomycetota bacterium]